MKNLNKIYEGLIATTKERSNERTITAVTNKRKGIVKNPNPEDIEYSERKIEIGQSS